MRRISEAGKRIMANDAPSHLNSAERDKRELLRDVHVAIKQIEAGEVVSNRQAKAELRRRFGR
ncbi:MAG TPA: hypothetical protein VEO74_07415 [Thermoanaerobaculia bacterium]|nr:hypothetical protein [Thermoanaerobaculia bacterium]